MCMNGSDAKEMPQEKSLFMDLGAWHGRMLYGSDEQVVSGEGSNLCSLEVAISPHGPDCMNLEALNNMMRDDLRKIAS